MKSQPPTVLVIEDDQDGRDALMLFLSISHVKAAAVESRDDALRFLAKDIPDVLLTDLWMPGMELPVFLAALRELPRVPKVIIMTALHDAERRLEGVSYDTFMKKPLDLDTLLKHIRRLSSKG